MARELFAPVGGRALGLRSEGRLACTLQLSCCAPGSSPAQLTAVQVGRAYARPARTAFNSAGLEPGAQQLSCKLAASQLPSERRPRALPPTGAESSLAV